MSYDEETTAINLSRLKELSALIDAGEAVKKVIESDGWTSHIGPLLDKMIVDVVGGKENGRWHNGSLLQEQIKDLDKVDLKSLYAYKHALTDFHMLIHQYIDNLEKYHEEYKQIIEEEKAPLTDQVRTDYDVEETELQEGVES